MMLIMNMLAPCLICGRFGCMFAAAAVRSVRRAKKERAHKALFFWWTLSRILRGKAFRF